MTETKNDIRNKAFKELLDFLNWVAENRPEIYAKLCEDYVDRDYPHYPDSCEGSMCWCSVRRRKEDPVKYQKWQEERLKHHLPKIKDEIINGGKTIFS